MYLTEEATVCMSTNVSFCVRWTTGDSSSDREEMDDTDMELLVERSNISRETGKSLVRRQKELWLLRSNSNVKMDQKRREDKCGGTQKVPLTSLCQIGIKSVAQVNAVFTLHDKRTSKVGYFPLVEKGVTVL